MSRSPGEGGGSREEETFSNTSVSENGGAGKAISSSPMFASLGIVDLSGTFLSARQLLHEVTMLRVKPDDVNEGGKTQRRMKFYKNAPKLRP